MVVRQSYLTDVMLILIVWKCLCLLLLTDVFLAGAVTGLLGVPVIWQYRCLRGAMPV